MGPYENSMSETKDFENRCCPLHRVQYRYTDKALKKAKAHSVDLYTLTPINKPIGEASTIFPNFWGCFRFWKEHDTFMVVPDGPVRFDWKGNDPILTSSGEEHENHSNMNDLVDSVIKRSEEALHEQEPMHILLIPNYTDDFALPYTHVLDIVNDGAYLMLENKLCRIDSVEISGMLGLQRRKIDPEFYVFKNAFDQKVFAGMTIASDIDDSRMIAMTYHEQGLTTNIDFIDIPEKHRNIIRKLKIN